MGLDAFFNKGNEDQSQIDLLIAENQKLKEQLRELKESDRLLRLITEKMQDMIFIVDTKIVYHYVSPSVKNITGVEPGDHKSYRTIPDMVRFDLNAGDVQLDVDTSIACGLLVNEIISNSLKYAFPSGRKGRIWLEMNACGEEVTMVLGDDGVGMPEGVDVASTGTLGVQLISSLVSRIGGSMQLERSQGTVYRIRFERKK